MSNGHKHECLNPCPDWIVDTVTATADAPGAYYKLHVRGVNLNNGEQFAWTVRDVADERYDLTNATISDAARPYLGR